MGMQPIILDIDSWGANGARTRSGDTGGGLVWSDGPGTEFGAFACHIDIDQYDTMVMSMEA